MTYTIDELSKLVTELKNAADVLVEADELGVLLLSQQDFDDVNEALALLDYMSEWVADEVALYKEDEVDRRWRRG